MQRSLAAVALAVLLVTAGCNGLGLADGGDGGDGGDTPDAANQIPGVEGGTVTNATKLLAAHDRGLVETGFENEVQVNATVIQQDQAIDTQRRQQTIVEAGADEYQYRTVNGQGGGFVRFDHWGNQSVWVTRGQLGNTTQFQVRNRAPATGSLTGSALLQNYLNGSEAEAVDVRQKNGLTLVTFETTTLPTDPDAIPVNDSAVSDYKARFVVDTQGRIHGLVIEGTYDLRGEARTFRVGYELKRLNGPSVSQPDWAGQALRNRSG